MAKKPRVPRTIEQQRRGNKPKDYNGVFHFPNELCPFLPGTPEKVLLLMYRAEHGLRLWDTGSKEHGLNPDRQHIQESGEACHGHKDNFGGLHNVSVTGEYVHPELSDELKRFLYILATTSPSSLKAFPDRILTHLPSEQRDRVRSAPDEDPTWEEACDEDIDDDDGAETFDQGAA